MVGRILPERTELKVGALTKKSQNKSFFFSSDNYKERVFVLDAHQLTYYSGTLEKRDDEKGAIQLEHVTAVETLHDERSPQCGFQVAHEDDGRPLILYIFGKTKEERDEWVSAIRTEALKNGAYFILNYHPACWERQKGFSCCGAPSRGDEGCMPVTKQTAEMRDRLLSKASSAHAGEIMADMMSKRSQGKSTFFGAINYKERVFVLDSRSLRYFGGNLRKREGEKGSVELCTVLAVEDVRDGLLDNRKNAFQVVYEDDDDDILKLIIVARSSDKRQAWAKAIRDEARKNNAKFQSHYHPGVWIKGLGKYNCCNDLDKDSEGCDQVTEELTDNKTSRSVSAGDRVMSPRDVKVGILTKRAQCKSSFYVSKSFRDRLFVLNNATLRYFKGKPKKRGEEKGSIPLVNITVVAPVNHGDLDGRKNALQVKHCMVNEKDERR
ncbi:hypothetical protein V1264_003731 [Littorina saxatilis]|uniref:PH domain-containing protein n=1 Tax=Littorina saxatilis TaxID=31220 RepID=A0AAN9G7H7_9CAEN